MKHIKQLALLAVSVLCSSASTMQAEKITGQAFTKLRTEFFTAISQNQQQGAYQALFKLEASGLDETGKQVLQQWLQAYSKKFGPSRPAPKRPEEKKAAPARPAPLRPLELRPAAPTRPAPQRPQSPTEQADNEKLGNLEERMDRAILFLEPQATRALNQRFNAAKTLAEKEVIVAETEAHHRAELIKRQKRPVRPAEKKERVVPGLGEKASLPAAAPASPRSPSPRLEAARPSPLILPSSPRPGAQAEPPSPASVGVKELTPEQRVNFATRFNRLNGAGKLTRDDIGAWVSIMTTNDPAIITEWLVEREARDEKKSI